MTQPSARRHASTSSERLLTADIGSFRARHLALAVHDIETPFGKGDVTVDEAESPLAWLARRKGKDGRPLIGRAQFAAGERLRAEFTRAHMMPRITANWQAAVSSGARAGSAADATDAVLAARQRVRLALDAVGPEFAGLLLDVCCFLKRLEDIERERQWPARSAKVVLQLGLDRLARHFGLLAQARGKSRQEVRTWLAPGAEFTLDAAEGSGG